MREVMPEYRSVIPPVIPPLLTSYFWNSSMGKYLQHLLYLIITLQWIKMLYIN